MSISQRGNRKYKTKRIVCKVHACQHAETRQFDTWEEKRTDVNIATQIMEDAYQDACDIFVVVSGDSDLVPPLLMVKQRFPEKKFHVYVPSRDKVRGAATELRGAADTSKTLPLDLLKRCRLPARVPDGAGGFIEKPVEW